MSRDKAVNADTDWGRDEEIWATYLQAAPLAGGCRLFAPGYRQLTIAGLAAHDLPNDLAYDDVRAAWRCFPAHDNQGRGVILVGHSQGSFTLRRLIAEEIDGNPEARRRLAAAYLAGVSLQVPAGADVGGDFRNIPLCRADDETGCVVTWSSCRSTSPPPPNAYFGRDADGRQAACVNPAAPGGGTGDLLPWFPAIRGATLTDPAGKTGDGQWLAPAAGGTITTPFVVLPGSVSGECTRGDGFGWLKLTRHGGSGSRIADFPAGDLTPEWGTHLVDINVVMGDLQRLMVAQGAAWLASHSAEAGRK